jgi:hypothetical protein
MFETFVRCAMLRIDLHVNQFGLDYIETAIANRAREREQERYVYAKAKTQ